jgi:hypothetical protein
MTFLTVLKDANASKASTIVFDLRLKHGSSVNFSSHIFRYMIVESIRSILPQPVPLPTSRSMSREDIFFFHLKLD